MSSPRTPWATRTPHADRTYTVHHGAPVMDAVGREMRARVRQLCTVQFGHEIFKDWDKRDKDKKNYIIEQIKSEFMPADETVSNDWIKSVCVSTMSHRKSEARDALKEGKSKPAWLDAAEWRQLQLEREENPDKFHQQREAAKKKNESVGSSHLGSGGYETLREEFVSP